ncbi:uncharacterized protein LOC126905240 isoform X2 [Daktulosphaira vitifoliae]|uniref:uncharacterized protein LOC126905240 isoform X2 n=1 Tax=Daktulosphaira vitifoliae TaxID=58002 RepID=UPI0021AA5BE7|nr:uncharacterized protein LOC126905240 isoform X2 [Daktulosphaira vitifoliae]
MSDHMASHHMASTITVSPSLNNDELKNKDVIDEIKAKVEEEDEEVEKDNKHFMDAYSLKSSPNQLEFGHVFEDPNVWEQRYEKKDFDDHRHQGKVKWGDKDGGYGEQYWDFNHGNIGESTYDDNGQNIGDQLDDLKNEPESTQESRPRPIIYKPYVKYVKRHKVMMRRPNRIIRSNYKKKPMEPLETTPYKGDREYPKSAPVLVFDMRTGVVLDESTGQKYLLKPFDDK